MDRGVTLRGFENDFELMNSNNYGSNILMDGELKHFFQTKKGELPYGWEKIDDPIYGSYYVDHINRRTQFENPVLEAKRRLQQQQQMQSQGLSSLPLPTIYRVEDASPCATLPRPPRGQAGPAGPVPERCRSLGDLSRSPALGRRAAAYATSSSADVSPLRHVLTRRMNMCPHHQPYQQPLHTAACTVVLEQPVCSPYSLWHFVKKPLFTRDPTQLKGSFLSTSLQKSNMGFGFTIIGGDEPDEFLQVKSVIPDGPAAADGKMATDLARSLELSSQSTEETQTSGRDVIVYINDVCVLGTTHADVVKLFQSVPIGQSVTLVLCRGYPLPYDPEDPANANTTTATTTTIISPLGIMEQRPIMVNGRTGYDNYLDYLTRTARFVAEPGQEQAAGQQQLLAAAHPGDTHLDGSLPATTGTTPPDSVSMASSGATQGELLTLTMVKGADGFGFTIADSAAGQRVKQVLEPQGCPGLCESDLIVEINKQPVQGFTHAQVVELLKECAVGAETSLVVQRGGAGKIPGPARPDGGARVFSPRPCLYICSTVFLSAGGSRDTCHRRDYETWMLTDVCHQIEMSLNLWPPSPDIGQFKGRRMARSSQRRGSE
ncbi:unnamed protein product [Menidia menidia]|uniref:(Atlantic silverside) hypothetical protein n=1 Tax=Menidia menidia TaxID=238744 RepID=A0A8S4B5W2_9TELE|nr:unnamed protein product [Menidia menidia]